MIFVRMTCDCKGKYRVRFQSADLALLASGGR